MAEEHGDRLEALFHQAADLPPEERQSFLHRVCAKEPGLHAAVERLLADDARLPDNEEAPFLRSPLVRIAADVFAATADSPQAPPLPSHMGRYRLIRLLGQGGMGAVYEAEQDDPRRTVALKVVRPGLASPSLLKRFRHESQILGRMHHPGIAQVYEAGLADDGKPFFAMEFIRGLPLDEYARTHARTLQARVELLARVCDAVQHAHEQGVIHRDLKPTNILVEDSGQPKVLDFGVARATDADLLTEAALTQTGQLLGTPNYMSPEQVSGDHAAIDRRADIYALGVILFELAVNRLPFRLENRPFAETARLILEEDPPKLGSIDPELRGDVETIVAKALEKDRARRYASAAELAADLRRWLAHEPILARPPSALYHLRKFTRRHRSLVGGVLATGAALVLGLIGTTLFAIAEAKQRDQAEQNALAAESSAHEADLARRSALRETYRAALAAASAALEAHGAADAARHLQSAPEDLRGWEWRHLHSRLDDSASLIPLPTWGPSLLVAAADGVRIATPTSAGLRLTNLEGGALETLPIRPERGRWIKAIQTERGLRIAVSGGKADVEVLDGAGRVLCRAAGPEHGHLSVFTLSSDGRRLACGWRDGESHQVAVFDATSGKQTAICNGHRDAIWTCAFSPDSARLASGSEDRTACLWDPATGTLLATCQGHTSKVVSTAFSPDGSRLVTASSDGMVRQWHARTGQEVEPPYERHSNEVYSAIYSPDGQWVASAGADRTIRVWQATGRQDLAVLHGHTGRVVEVAFTPDGRRLASMSCSSAWVFAGDDTARIWDVDPTATLPVLHGHTRDVYPVAYSPDGRWLASGSWDKSVRLWDAATGEPCAILPHPSTVGSLAFGPDGTWLVTGCHEYDRLRIWDVATARVRKEIQFPGSTMLSPMVSPDGTRVATTTVDPKSYKNRLTVCDIVSETPLFSAEGSGLAYSPDGRWLAALAADGKTVLLMDARTHETRARFSGHEQAVFKAVFSPDSRSLASCSRDHTVRLWNVAGDGWRAPGKEEVPRETGSANDNGMAIPPPAARHPPPDLVLRGHTDEVYAVAFHPDGTRLATAGRDGSVSLWDLAWGEEVVRLPGHKSFVWSLAFSPDGTTLASGSGDGTVRLRDTTPLMTRHKARREVQQARPAAERLIERLFHEHGTADKVAERLRTETAQNAPLERAARKALYRRLGVAPP
jgi:WD40 repeat protein/predicted Ser/Thr protein kinase